jgi:hypothetical protein
MESLASARDAGVGWWSHEVIEPTRRPEGMNSLATQTKSADPD